MRDPQQADPDADHRNVQQQQHDVADIGRGDQAPEDFRVLRDQQRPGLNALHQHGRDHQRRDRRKGNAEREQRHQRGGGGGIVGGFRAGDAFDGAAADLGGMFRSRLFQPVGGERGQRRRRTRHQAEQKAEEGAAQP